VTSVAAVAVAAVATSTAVAVVTAVALRDSGHPPTRHLPSAKQQPDAASGPGNPRSGGGSPASATPSPTPPCDDLRNTDPAPATSPAPNA